ncbi:MAG: type 4a pilus biogenesis protein PilO [Woeseiaceae bacterium]|nr:type 4a pilus biogenesis protein PilO [Woeseiaceae bacterium]
MQELLRKVSLRELRLLLAGVGAVVVVGLAVSLLIPEIKKLIAANKNVEVLRAAAQDTAELEQHMQEEHERIEDLRFRLYGDMADLPLKQVEAYIIGRLQEISWGTDVDLVSVQPAAGERVQIFQEMLFNVELIGHYDDLYRWLWDVRNELGYVVIKEYGLTRQNDDDDEPLLVADLSLASYRAVQ